MTQLPDIHIFLARDDFEAVPQHPLPAGYHFRLYRPGDEVIWTELHREADRLIQADDDLFQRQFGAVASALPQRMYFVDTGHGDTVASITAWWEHGPDRPNDRGRIHWVVVRTDHQQRGIAKAMMTHAMARLAQDHAAAMLDTSSARPWAVKTYLDFGFHPEASDLADPERRRGWLALQDLLRHPRLDGWLRESAISP